MSTFKLTISSVGKNLFTGDARSLTVPGVEGELTVLANHEPLVTALRNTSMSYIDSEGTEHTLTLPGNGVLEVSNNQVTVLL